MVLKTDIKNDEIKEKGANTLLLAPFFTDISNKPLFRYLLDAHKIRLEYLTLNTEQRAVYDTVMDGEMHISISSMPGCGKTYLAGVIARAIRFYSKNPIRIFAVAPSHKAKAVLSESLGFDAQTIHRHCGYTLDEGDAIATDGKGKLVKVGHTEPADVLIVDEVSMTPDDLFQDAIGSARVVIALGDKNQLDVVSGKAADLSMFSEFVLTQQMRQNDTGKCLFKTIEKLKDAIEGNMGFTPIGYDNTFIKGQSLDELYLNGSIDVIGAFTNNCVDNYNMKIQQVLRGTPDICNGDSLILQAPMKSVSERKGKKIYPIVANNGDIIKISKIGKKYDNGAIVIKVENVGDRILVPKNFYSRTGSHSPAWSMYKKEFGNYGWNEFKAMTVTAKLPYAMTIHKMQGSTYDSVGIDINNIHLAGTDKQRNRLMYVGISRAKSKCYVKAG